MRHSIVLTLGFLLGLACSLAEELEGAACNGDGDCDKSQSCVRTLHQQQLGGPGSCSSSGTCVDGEQPGCACTSERTCAPYELFPTNHATELDENNAPRCFCCPSAVCEDGQMPAIVDLSDDGSARCSCCPVCDEGQILELEDDGDVAEPCHCIPDPAVAPTTDTDGSGSGTE
jgi:hypothetical protein